MTQDSIDRWRQRLDELWARCGNVKPGELMSIAESFGRKRIKRSTPHPTYESPLPGRPPMTISGHTTMGKKWVKDAITALRGDLDVLEQIEQRRIKELRSGNGHA